jgi:hypothetical protein
MFGMPLPLEEFELPSGCAFTTNRRYRRDASAVVFHIPTLRSLSGLVRYPGQLWVAWFLESSAHYSLLNNSGFMAHFDLTMSYRRQSDIRTPCFSRSFDMLARGAPGPKPDGRLMATFISSSTDRSGRSNYVKELMRYMDLHNYGRFMRNRTLSKDSGRETKLRVLAGYKFDLAYENAIENDYVTEKFFDPLEAGCVPVYTGAPNIENYAPGKNCYINAADFNSPKDLADYLSALNEDKKAYGAFHAWRRQSPRAQYRKFMEEQQIHPFVRLCEAVQQRS